MKLNVESLLLEHGPDHFDLLKKTRLQIDGVDDLAEWRVLKVSRLSLIGRKAIEEAGRSTSSRLL